MPSRGEGAGIPVGLRVIKQVIAKVNHRRLAGGFTGMQILQIVFLLFRRQRFGRRLRQPRAALREIATTLAGKVFPVMLSVAGAALAAPAVVATYLPATLSVTPLITPIKPSTVISLVEQIIGKRLKSFT